MMHIGSIVGIALSLSSGWAPAPIRFVGSYMGEQVQICVDGGKVETAFAGKLRFQTRTGQFTSVCADVRAPIGAGATYVVRPQSSHRWGGNVALAGNIVARYFRYARTPAQCAGLQLAVWKVLDDGLSTTSFSVGRFRATSDAITMEYARRYLLGALQAENAQYLQAGGGGAGGGQFGGGQGGGPGGQGAGGLQSGGGGGGGQGQLTP